MKLKDLGFREGINEVVGITFGESEKGERNAAPLGVIVEDENSRTAKLRLFYRYTGKSVEKTHTMKNVEKGSKIYANVCFDPLAFAISAFEDLGEEFFESEFVLRGAYSVCVFDVKRIEKLHDLWLCELEAVDGWVVSGARAFSRGFAAVVEAAVHATRYVYSTDARKEVEKKILELGSVVERCGGKREREAYRYILNRVGMG